MRGLPSVVLADGEALVCDMWSVECMAAIVRNGDSAAWSSAGGDVKHHEEDE